MAVLVSLRGPNAPQVFTLDGAITYVGRSPESTICLDDLKVSRRHAQVSHAEGDYYIEDINSTNGTWLNGGRIHNRTRLSVGDQLQFGPFVLVFRLQPDSNGNDNEFCQMTPSSKSELRKNTVGEYVIEARLATPRFLACRDSQPASDVGKTILSVRHDLNRELARLYQLAIDMGATNCVKSLAAVVLDGLFESIKAETGVVQLMVGDSESVVLAARKRCYPNESDPLVSRTLTREVLRSREAILAKGPGKVLSETLKAAGVTSAICAPASAGNEVVGLIHLYLCSRQDANELDLGDLEFTLAVARQFGNALKHLQRHEALAFENRLLHEQMGIESELLGASSAIMNTKFQIRQVASTNATVLVRGESGAGKELVARAIHRNSRRNERPFVCLNCAAISETLLESELFGHEKGAFTNAIAAKKGRFEMADGGTIFLDEIGEMSLGAQAKLLRVLEGHPFERVGGCEPLKVDVRIIAATNQPLESNVNARTFRADLFHRLNVVSIFVPPVRERGGDILLLAEHFRSFFVQQMGRKARSFTGAAVAKLEAYPWPGNVRELRNAIERAVALSNGPVLDAEDIWLPTLGTGVLHFPSFSTASCSPPPSAMMMPSEGSGLTPSIPSAGSYSREWDPQIEKARIDLTHYAQVLERHGWDKGNASRDLFGHREALTRKIRRIFSQFPELRADFATIATRFPQRVSRGRPSDSKPE